MDLPKPKNYSKNKSHIMSSTLKRSMLIRKIQKVAVFIIAATVLTVATIGLVQMINKQKVNHDKLNELIRNEQKLKLDSSKKQQELQNQIEELKKQVEAKRQSKLAEAAEAAAKQVAPVAQASTVPNGSCRDWIVAAGVTDIESAYTIIMRESGCRPTARNASSGAYGIPQALPASKIAYCGNDPICQIQWMQNYVNNRYGGWAGAVSFWNQHHWY
jgi:hypothetical protein